MSKMGNFVFDVQERYESGESVEQIVKATGTSKYMVKNVIYEYLGIKENVKSTYKPDPYYG